MKKQCHGFTLVELMVVIVILGILTAIGTFAFQTSQQKSRDSRRKNDISQVTKALELYNNDHSVYPGATDKKIDGCGATYTSTCEWGAEFGNSSANVIYMIKLPNDPSITRTKYVYEVVGTKGYRLYAYLENSNDVDIPTTGKKYYNMDCSVTAEPMYCNYVVTSGNVTTPAVVP